MVSPGTPWNVGIADLRSASAAPRTTHVGTPDRSQRTSGSERETAAGDVHRSRRSARAREAARTRGSSTFGLRGRRSFDRMGVAPRPTLCPEAESGIGRCATETRRSQRVSRTVASEGCARKYALKGGLPYVRADVAPRVAPTGLSGRSDRGKSELLFALLFGLPGACCVPGPASRIRNHR